MTQNVLQGIQTFHDDLIEWRHDLHRHPEIGFEEKRTSDVIAQRLEGFGIEVDRGLGGTGVVGTLRAGSSERAIGLRADIDALPILENNTFEHRSQNEGCMHACGHDGHTTMLLGAARHLAQNPDFDGTVHFIFQPAEESGLAGGQRMVKEGLFEKFPVDGVYGMHNWPGLEVGRFGAMTGPIMAAADFFEFTVTGSGCHAAMPNLGVDPFVATRHLLAELQTIPSRRIAATEAMVISVTQVHGGSTFNVIPDTVKVCGTVRALNEDIRDLAEPAFRDIAAGIGQMTGTEITLDYNVSYPVTVNTPDETGYAAHAAASLVGRDNVQSDMDPSMGAEDFAFMLRAKPGAYLWLGNGTDSAPLHSSVYDFNDDILPMGAAYWVQLAHEQLPK